MSSISPRFLVICASISLGSLISTPAWSQGKQREEGSVHRAVRDRHAEAERSAAGIRQMRPPSARVELRRLTADERKPVTRKPGLTPAGVARQLPADALSHGEWSTSPEGRAVWRLALDAPDAAALRVRFADFHVGAGTVWLLGTDSDGAAVTAGPYTGDGPSGDGEFWSDIVAASSVTIAWEPEAGTAADSAVPFAIPEISHRFGNAVPKSSADAATNQTAVASCALDSSCYSEYSEPASAVALMIFESNGESYDCTGSLISSSSQPAVPYFLTANHCISTPAEAKSLIAVFNYQTPTCNGTAPRLGGLPRVTGASLIAGAPMSEGDYTLLQLNRFPDIDVKLLGWSADPISAAEQVIGISHPLGDYKRIAFGERTRDVTIRFDDGARMPASVGYQVSWLQGLTQSGSSGSPLLATINGRQYVVGTLTAGPDVDESNDAQVCRTRNLVASYGRFSAAWPAISSFLTSRTTSAPTQLSFAASPSGLSQSPGSVTLSWQAPNVSQVQIRVGSPYGTPLTGFEGPVGSAQTGAWVTPGMIFFLQNATSGDSAGPANTITTVQVGSTSSVSGFPRGSISAAPVTFSSGGARTTLSWQATGVSSVQVRVNSPFGPPMTGYEAPVSSAITGDWVTDGMTFYLQDASNGDSSGLSRTLATVRVRLGR